MGKAPYDPDRWLRQWAAGLGVLLLVAFWAPGYSPSRPDPWRWRWADVADATSAVRVFAPAFAGILALAAALVASPASRRLLVVLAALTAAAGFTADTFAPSHGLSAFDAGLRFAVAGGAVLAAALNHLRRRRPERDDLRRALLPIGVLVVGLAVVDNFTLRIVPGRLGDDAVLWPTVYVGVYGLLTTAHARSKGRVAARSEVLAVLTRAFLPCRMVGICATSLGYEPLVVTVADFVRFLAIDAGPAVCALAVAASLECRLAESPFPGQLPAVFE